MPLLWIKKDKKINKIKTFMQCVTQLIKLIAKVNENILQSFKSESAPWPFLKLKAASHLQAAYIIKPGLFQLKVGYVIFQKRFRKLSGGPVLKQTCSQSAVRGVSTHDAEERALSAHDGH